MNINLYDELMDRMDFEAYFPSMSHSEIEVYARIENFYRGLEALKIKRAKANIYYEGKVIKTINLTDIANGEIIDNTQVFDIMYNYFTNNGEIEVTLPIYNTLDVPVNVPWIALPLIYLVIHQIRKKRKH